MSTRRLARMLVTAAAFAGCSASFYATAQAAFKPFQLVSASPALQAEYAYEPAVSAEGRYVVFTGIVGSKHGVYRKDLLSGDLATVALGEATGAPSVSADGRYVSFTSADDPGTGREPVMHGCTQVYVRDMTKGRPTPEGPEGLGDEEGEFRLASARDDSEDEPLTYAGSGVEGCPGGGSSAAGSVALSADGLDVAFTVLGPSDLTAQRSEEGTPTPGGQVVVRDFATSPATTTLVSTLLGSAEPVPRGAALSNTPRISGRLGLAHEAASTAGISANGNAVAWMGIDVAAQANVSNPPKDGGYADGYAEPLWREVGEHGQPSGETRRVLAGDDLSAPGCPPACQGGLALDWDEEAVEHYEGLGPEYGSYISEAESGFRESVEAVTPQLSADGRQVAVLSTQPSYGHLPNFGSLPRTNRPPANAFVVNMTPGLTREQAITRLTDWASPEFESATLDGAIEHLAISADGSRVLFATDRETFPLAPPTLISAPVSQSPPASQLYEANLQAGTLALVSEGYDGEPANFEGSSGGVGGAALSADGRVIALASGSSNLAFGSVSDGSGVYFTEEENAPAALGIQTIGPLPPGPGAAAAWSVSATARSGARGALLIDVSVPGPGRLAASASSAVPVSVVTRVSSRGSARAHGGRAASGSRGRARSAAPARRRVASSPKRTIIATRQVARAAARVLAEGVLELRLVPSSAYRSLASSKTGLFATILVTFAAPGHPALSETLQASFPRPPAARTAKPRASKQHRTVKPVRRA